MPYLDVCIADEEAWPLMVPMLFGIIVHYCIASMELKHWNMIKELWAKREHRLVEDISFSTVLFTVCEPVLKTLDFNIGGGRRASDEII